MTIGAAWMAVLRQPYFYLVRKWNWKSAVTSALIRGAIFFATNIGAGLTAALGAMGTEWAYRSLLSGANGSVTQALRRAEPPWAAMVSASVILPVVNHSFEFGVHWLRGTPHWRTSVLVSLMFTLVSTLFNMYAMRRGVLVVDSGRSLALILQRCRGLSPDF